MPANLLTWQKDQIAWLRNCQLDRPGLDEDGAIGRYPDQNTVNPYFANFAALALLTDPLSRPLVQRYLDWYVRHLEDDGSIRDYDYAAGRTGAPDSADAYAGTFLILAARYHRAAGGDWTARNLPALKKVGRVITRLMDRDGLTFALPTHRVKYLMDNCEAWRGLADLGALLGEMGDVRASFFARRAATIRQGIEKTLWDQRQAAYRPYRTACRRPKVKWDRYYPNAVCQLFPSLYGLIDPASPRATHLYRTFNHHYPAWTRIGPPDFPWVILAYWAARQGDHGAALEKLLFVQKAYIDASSGAWYCAEAAFFVLTCSLLTGGAGLF